MEKHTRLVVRVLKCFIDLKHPSLKEVAERYNSLNTLSFMSRLYRRVVWRKVTEEEILWALQDLIEEGLIKIGDDPMRDTFEEVYVLTKRGTQRLGEMKLKKKKK